MSTPPRNTDSCRSIPSGRVMRGHVAATHGPLVLAVIPLVAVGDLCLIEQRGDSTIPAQVVGFDERYVQLAPLGDLNGIAPGAVVTSRGRQPAMQVSSQLIGKVLDALGQPTAQPCIPEGQEHFFDNRPPNPMSRRPITDLLSTGIKSIDGLCSIGYGQRMALLAEAGLGKSTLIAMIAKNARVDLSIIALVGERGREVSQFIEHTLGAEGMKRAIVVYSTSDEPPFRRMLSAYCATTIAEYFRRQRMRVLLMVDSLTRVARAIRDVSLASGEIPVRQGYTPSVYARLPGLLERGGNDDSGSITAIYTLLTNPEEDGDPLADEIKSLVDGHIILDRRVAQSGLYPAIDPLRSVSRLMTELHNQQYLAEVLTIRRMMSRLSKDKDLVLLGGEPDSELRAALELEPRLIELLGQPAGHRHDIGNTLQTVSQLAQAFRAKLASASTGNVLQLEPGLQNARNSG